MNIALISDPENKNGDTWENILTTAGHTVLGIESSDYDASIASKTDVCLPLISVRDYTNPHTGRYQAAKELEIAGIPMINSSKAIAFSSDKLLSYHQWKKYGLKQPVTALLSSLDSLPENITAPFIIKPSLGHSGKNVKLVQTIEEAKSISLRWQQPVLAQEYIKQPRCIRVIATQTSVLACYERILPGAVAANVSQGATRHNFEPSQQLAELATEMVTLLDGHLMGVDVLIKGNEMYALEANVPFGFDKHDSELKSRFVQFIEGFTRAHYRSTT